MKALFASEFGRFLAVGGFAALVNFISRIYLSEVMDLGWAVFIAYIIGMLTAYVMSKVFVFAPSGKHPANELLYFTLVNIVAVAQVWVITIGLAEYVFPAIGFHIYSEDVAHLIGLSIPVISSYFGHKYFSFKSDN